MKIECSREKLIQALQYTDKISRKNLSLPILSKVLLVTEGNSLQLKATNLAVGVDAKLAAVVQDGGTVALDGALLLQVLQQAKRNEKVTLVVNEGELRVEADGVKVTLQTYQADDFPTLPHVEDGVRVTMSVESFISGVKSVAYSAAVTDIKPEIASVYMYRDERDLVFVATDSFRLAEKRLRGVFGPDTAFESLLLPASSLQEVVRILEDAGDGDFDFIAGENLVEFLTGTVSITERLIDGSFPDYRMIIPKDFQAEAVLLKQELIDQLRLVTLFSDKFQQLDVSVDPAEKVLMVSAANNEVGSGEVKLMATLKGEALVVRLNHRYLMDGFQSIHEDSVEVLFSGERKPVVIRGIGDTSFTYLVMPMNR